MKNESFSAQEAGARSSDVGSERYELESGIVVELKWKEFSPEADPDGQNPEEARKAATIFLPGWAMGEDNETITELCQSFADRSKSPTYAITTRAEQHVATGPAKDGKEIDFLYEEAKAISRFIKENDIEEVTLTGHSQGGDRAMDLADILQNDPEIKVDGLVLMAPAGLYDQNPVSLTKNFILDGVATVPIDVVSKLPNIKQTLEATKIETRTTVDVLMNIMKEMYRSGLDYKARTDRETKEMAAINRRAGNINVPIVLIMGADDGVSDIENVIPPEEMQRREDYLMESIFPNSPFVRMVIPEKSAHHKVAFTRARSVATAALYHLSKYDEGRAE